MSLVNTIQELVNRGRQAVAAVRTPRRRRTIRIGGSETFEDRILLSGTPLSKGVDVQG